MKEKERLGTTQHEETTLKPHEAQYVRDTCNEPSFKNICWSYLLTIYPAEVIAA